MIQKQPDIRICDLCGQVVDQFAHKNNSEVVYHVTREYRAGGTRCIDQCLTCAEKVKQFFDRESKDGTSSKGSE